MTIIIVFFVIQFRFNPGILGAWVAFDANPRVIEEEIGENAALKQVQQQARRPLLKSRLVLALLTLTAFQIP